MRRDEPVNGAGPHEHWYRYGGKEMGTIATKPSLDTDYAQSIYYRQSRPYSSDDGNEFHGDFDQGLERINSYYQGSAGGAYIVRVGDTLSSIAANLWGDSSLWYKIAEANGLGANAELDEGQVLSLPTGAMRNSYNARTFDPYNPAETIGNVSPTAPDRGHNGCGVVGQIIMVIVAIVVTIYSGFTASGVWASVFGEGTVAAGVATGVTAGAAGWPNSDVRASSDCKDCKHGVRHRPQT